MLAVLCIYECWGSSKSSALLLASLSHDSNAADKNITINRPLLTKNSPESGRSSTTINSITVVRITFLHDSPETTKQVSPTTHKNHPHTVTINDANTYCTRYTITDDIRVTNDTQILDADESQHHQVSKKVR